MGSVCSSPNNEPSAPQGRGGLTASSSPPPPQQQQPGPISSTQQQQQPSACSANPRGENKEEVVEKKEPQLTDQQRHVKSVEANPSDAAAWHAIGSDLPSGGTVLIGGTVLVTEQQCFQKVLELEPDNSNAWRKIGTTVATGTEVMVGGVGYTGQQCYVKAIELQPKDSYAWYNLGASLPDGSGEEGDGGGEGIAAVVEVGGKEYTRIQCYVQAVQVNPQNGIAWRNLGTTLSEENPTVEVSGENLSEQQCYVKSIECDATDTGSWYNLGTTLEANSVVVSGETVTERICFIKVLELSSSSPSSNNLNAWGMLGIALTSAGEEDVTVGGIPYTRKQCLTQGGPPYDQIA